MKGYIPQVIKCPDKHNQPQQAHSGNLPGGNRSVIKALEEGTIIWHSPLNKFGLQKNITSDVNY